MISSSIICEVILGITGGTATWSSCVGYTEDQAPKACNTNNKKHPRYKMEVENYNIKHLPKYRNWNSRIPKNIAQKTKKVPSFPKKKVDKLLRTPRNSMSFTKSTRLPGIRISSVPLMAWDGGCHFRSLRTKMGKPLGKMWRHVNKIMIKPYKAFLRPPNSTIV